MALVRVWFADMGAPTLDPLWVVGAFAVGVLVTVAAAWLPTRSATRVTPLAALRPDTGPDVRSTAGPDPAPARGALPRGWLRTARALDLDQQRAGDARRWHGRLRRRPAPRPVAGPGTGPGRRPARRRRPGAPPGCRQRGAQSAAYGDDGRLPAGRRHPHDRCPDRPRVVAHGARRRDGRVAPARRDAERGRRTARPRARRARRGRPRRGRGARPRRHRRDDRRRTAAARRCGRAPGRDPRAGRPLAGRRDGAPALRAATG